MMALAADLEPMAAMAEEGGPMNTRSLASQASAKPVFSERKP